MLLVDITSRGAGLFGSRTAVRTSDGAQTYRQLHAGVCGLIDLLATAGGVGRGTRLAILAPNGIVSCRRYSLRPGLVPSSFR
jgi:acyl-CoA synthetase (AMP-forming)/AMP-acid ligase II